LLHTQLCRANKTFLHADIAQMAGKVPMDVNDLGIDLASISSHKVEKVKNVCIDFKNAVFKNCL
jgi:cysteine desulfurase